MLKGLDLDLDLQTRSKVTRQKWKPVKPTEKILNTVIMKREEESLRESIS
jgi:hypothetical protein